MVTDTELSHAALPAGETKVAPLPAIQARARAEANRQPPTVLVDLVVSAFEDAITKNTELETMRAGLAARNAEARKQIRDQQAQLDAMDSRCRNIVDHLNDAVLVLDHEMRLVDMNRRAVEVLGRACLERGERHILGLVCLEHRRRVRALIRRLMDEGAVQAEGVGVTRADGSAAILDVSASLVESGGQRLVLVIARDVTESQRIRAQLVASDRLASVGTLAASVAHEINNPLAAVIANLDLAIGDLARQGRVADELRDAREAADRVRLIVRDLKVFSRPEDERRGPVDLYRVIESSLRMAWNELRHRARLVKDYGRVPPVDGNEARLGQVFLNLVVNAAQAIPEGNVDGNEVRITTSLDPSGRVLVEVRDTGPGIPAEAIDRIFLPFFTTKPRGVGTGLGLSICHRIITGLGGEIRVESEPGKGTVFRVFLSVAQLDAEEPRPDVEVAPRAATRRGRILVVDDEPAIAAVMRRVLGAEHDVVTTTSAADALGLLGAGNQFDAILCDLMMPQMSGMDLHAEILRAAPDVAARMIFLTGGAFTPAAREFLESVPNMRLEKPFDVQGLRALLNDRIR